MHKQLTLVISTSVISNNPLSQSENLILVVTEVWFYLVEDTCFGCKVIQIDLDLWNCLGRVKLVS